MSQEKDDANFCFSNGPIFIENGEIIHNKTTSTSTSTSASTSASTTSPTSTASTASTASPTASTCPVIGVCAMDSKAKSKPSLNILRKLTRSNEFRAVLFGEETIFNKDIESWPVCQYLISFYSTGFPLDKTIAYYNLRTPFAVNDLPLQKLLWDRRICLRVLDQLHVRTPDRVEVNRPKKPQFDELEWKKRLLEFSRVTQSSFESTNDVHMIDDNECIVVDGKSLYKPFVEKPVDADDHNVYIYYSKKNGGGGRKLFRKVKDKSSAHDSSLSVPRAILEPNSSYIYERFMQSERSEDVKVYTVGPDFAYAETRKSPTVDGIVLRNQDGKEIRSKTELNENELKIAARICVGFGQRVCGFDMLRIDNSSYVIDVNGWSFVKNNETYYDRCAQILLDLFRKNTGAGGDRETLLKLVSE